MKFKITAIIYDKKGRVLSIGKNSYVKTHPLQAKHAKHLNKEHSNFLHAEVHAIIRCEDISKAHRISIFRFKANGEPALSKPCVICQHAISLTPIKVVEHT